MILLLLALAALLSTAEAAMAEAPELAPFWRTFFARPQVAAPSEVELLRAALGKRLFRDTRLSADETRSCATCHIPDRNFTDGRPRGAGRDGTDLERNTPSLWNLAGARSYYWDGRAATLEAQAAIPIQHPNEMAGVWSEIIGRLKRDAELDVAFHAAFTERPAIQPVTVLAALAAYERTLVSPLTAFDRWVGGDDHAMGTDALAGFKLFVGRAGCVACHSTWRFTDDRFHDIGLASPDPGRGAVAGGVPGLASFKTPGLREVRWSAPYMHDGSKADLASVLDHYAGGLDRRPGVSSSLPRNLKLDRGERADLIAFLHALSSPEPPKGK